MAEEFARKILEKVKAGDVREARLSVGSELAALGRALEVSNSGAVAGSADVGVWERFLRLELAKASALVGKLPSGYLATRRPLLSSVSFSPEELRTLDEINAILREDYRVRRQMLLKRFDVTLRSFLWSPKVEGREDEVEKAIDEVRRDLSEEPVSVTAREVLFAGDELVRGSEAKD